MGNPTEGADAGVHNGEVEPLVNVHVVLAGTFPLVFEREEDAEAYASASGNAGVFTCALRSAGDARELDDYEDDDEDEDDGT